MRVFVAPSNIDGDRVTVTGADAHHISRVMRMEIGDRVTVCDGGGLEYRCAITTVGDSVTLEIAETVQGAGEPPVHIHLLQGVPKGDKMDYIAQKATELGVCRITPVLMRNCVSKGVKHERLSRIVYEAAKQCGRARVPAVDPVMPLDRAIPDGVPVVVAYEGETSRTLRAALDGVGSVRQLALVVGPEGGFARGEVDRIVDGGGIAVTLGSRVLRTETAALYMLSCIDYHYARTT